MWESGNVRVLAFVPMSHQQGDGVRNPGRLRDLFQSLIKGSGDMMRGVQVIIFRIA